jgi:hypothetical protein
LNLQCDVVDDCAGMRFKAARLLSPLKGDIWGKKENLDNNLSDSDMGGIGLSTSTIVGQNSLVSNNSDGSSSTSYQSQTTSDIVVSGNGSSGEYKYIGTSGGSDGVATFDNIKDEQLISMMTQIENKSCIKPINDNQLIDIMTQNEMKRNLQSSEDDLLIAIMDQIENRHSKVGHDCKENFKVFDTKTTENVCNDNVKEIDHDSGIDINQMEIVIDKNDDVFDYDEDEIVMKKDDKLGKSIYISTYCIIS